MESEEDISDIQDESSTYGDIPEETINLIDIAFIKNLAGNMGFSVIKQKPDTVVLYFAEPAALDLEEIGQLLVQWQGKLMFSAGNQPYLSLRTKGMSTREILNNIKILLQGMQKLKSQL